MYYLFFYNIDNRLADTLPILPKKSENNYPGLGIIYIQKVLSSGFISARS